MAQNSRVIRRPTRPAAVAKPAPVSVKEEDFDEEEYEEVEEEEDEAPPASKAKGKPAPVLPTPNKPVIKKMVIPTVPSDELKEAVNGEVETLSDPVPGLLELLEDGKTLVIQKVGKLFRVSLSEVAVSVHNSVKPGRVDGGRYWDTVLSEEYVTWQADWQKLSLEEKIKKAKKAGAVWVEHENIQTHAMRISAAYREVVGIEKYKPEYESRAARDSLRKQLTS